MLGHSIHLIVYAKGREAERGVLHSETKYPCVNKVREESSTEERVLHGLVKRLEPAFCKQRAAIELEDDVFELLAMCW